MRGQKYTLSDGESVTILDTAKEFVKVLNMMGKIRSIHKNELGLPVIDTAYYEKVDESPT